MIIAITTQEIIEFTRIYLAVFYSLVALFYSSRVIFMKRKISKELIFPGERFCKSWWNHLTFRIFRVAIWMVCLFRWIFPSIDQYLVMINLMQNTWLIIFGNLLLTVGFFLTVMINFKLGREWRSGIDPDGPKTIITNGLYRFSRNPMFVFVAISQVGFFLAVPSMFTLVCLLIGLYTLNSQAIEEEKHLLQVFPLEYENYLSQVRRWV
ncbi:MAG: isoprenylcysteine carboxylmethyltransferase family protein [Gammaproteobacteria bacterium]|nr:isoprenylcysteine carboxylmethyltransferase family protein [Gammaproteobacteria bacterium]